MDFIREVVSNINEENFSVEEEINKIIFEVKLNKNNFRYLRSYNGIRIFAENHFLERLQTRFFSVPFIATAFGLQDQKEIILRIAKIIDLYKDRLKIKMKETTYDLVPTANKNFIFTRDLIFNGVIYTIFCKVNTFVSTVNFGDKNLNTEYENLRALYNAVYDKQEKINIFNKLKNVIKKSNIYYMYKDLLLRGLESSFKGNKDSFINYGDLAVNFVTVYGGILGMANEDNVISSKEDKTEVEIFKDTKPPIKIDAETFDNIKNWHNTLSKGCLMTPFDSKNTYMNLTNDDIPGYEQMSKNKQKSAYIRWKRGERIRSEKASKKMDFKDIGWTTYEDDWYKDRKHK